MRVILQGSLRHFAARELLSLFAAHAHSGTFDAEADGERVRLAFRDGHVVAAEGVASGDAVDVVARLLGMTDGTFNFLDEAAVSDAPLDLEIDALLTAAEERANEAKRSAQIYPDTHLVFRVVNRPPGEINLVAEEFQLLFQIGGGKSLAQLLTDTKRTAADLYPIVKRLQMGGLIEPVADAEATMREKPPEMIAPPAAAPAPPAPPSPAPEPAPAAPAAAASLATVSTPLPPPPTLAERIRKPTEEKPGLVGTLTADDGTMHPLLEDDLTIGRTGTNGIALKDPSVSANHARVMRGVEGFTIEDIGSRNGTFVNGDKISEKRVLADGDLVRIGKVILTFNLAAEVKREDATQVEKI
jgi:hypothetical protein